MSLKKQLLRGFSGSLGLKMFHLGVGFLSTWLMARALGLKPLGVYTYVISWMQLLVVFAQLGLNVLAVREVSKALHREDWGYLKGFSRFANRSVFISSLLLAAIGWVIVHVAYSGGTQPEMTRYFLIAFAIVPFLALARIRQSTLRGLQKVIQGQIPELFVRPILMVGLFGYVYLWGPTPMAVDTALYFNLGTTVAAFILGSWLLHRSLPLGFKQAAAELHARSWMMSSMSFLFIAGMQIINTRVDRIMLGIFSDIENVGIYFVSSQIASVTVFSLIAVNATITPHIVKFKETGEKDRLQRMLITSSAGALGISLCIAAGILVLGKPILGVFGKQFEVGNPILYILVLGCIVNVAAGSAGMVLNMTGHEKIVGLAVAISAVVNVILNAWWIPLWGIYGAAWATVCCIAIWNGYLVVEARRRLGIRCTCWSLLWLLKRHG